MPLPRDSKAFYGSRNRFDNLKLFLRSYERRNEQTRKLKSWLKAREARGAPFRLSRIKLTFQPSPESTPVQVRSSSSKKQRVALTKSLGVLDRSVVYAYIFWPGIVAPCTVP